MVFMNFYIEFPLLKIPNQNGLGFILFYNGGVNKKQPIFTGRNNCRIYNPHTDDIFPAMLDTLFDQ